MLKSLELSKYEFIKLRDICKKMNIDFIVTPYGLEDVEILDFGEAPINGRSDWVEYVKGALNNYGPTQHMLGPQLATIDGDNAHCRTDVQALHYLKQPEGEILTLWATYETDMIRTDDGWKISRHRLVSRGIRQN